MSKKIVYICSPLQGNMQENITKAQLYCRSAMLSNPDVVPIAPHIYFTQFLNDLDPIERSLGMTGGLDLLKKCDEMWVFGIENPSEGMRLEMECAKLCEIPILNGHKVLHIDSTTEKEGAKT